MISNKSRGCVKSADMKFGNDQISGVRHFDEMSRWTGWSKIEFSHSPTPEPTAVGASRFTRFGSACLNFGRSIFGLCLVFVAFGSGCTMAQHGAIERALSGIEKGKYDFALSRLQRLDILLRLRQKSELRLVI